MSKKPVTKKGGAPEWMVTYGDLMSLLLCFFVLLFSMSSLDVVKMADAIESLNEGFGYHGSGEASNIDVVQQRVNALNRGRKVHTEKEKTPKAPPDTTPQESESPTPSVTKANPSDKPGVILQFDLGSDELNSISKERLKVLYNDWVGLPYKIVIKGHAAAGELGIYRQGIDLAYTRAVNTRDYLVSLGLKEGHFQIVVLGQFEPIKRPQRSLKIPPREINAVVEVILSDTFR